MKRSKITNHHKRAQKTEPSEWRLVKNMHTANRKTVTETITAPILGVGAENDRELVELLCGELPGQATERPADSGAKRLY